MTRSPIRTGSTPEPTAAISPQTSAPWIRGKEIGALPQVGSSSPTSANASPVVASFTFFEYQPERVLTSVLFRPQARTRISTSPASGSGRGQFSYSFICSRPPWPTVTMARIVFGRLAICSLFKCLCVVEGFSGRRPPRPGHGRRGVRHGLLPAKPCRAWRPRA